MVIVKVQAMILLQTKLYNDQDSRVWLTQPHNMI